jgi:hypothetical protein
MGYRLRIGRISKAAHEKYGALKTAAEVLTAAGLGDGDGVYRSLPEYTELHELGKGVDYSKGTTPFFAFKLDDEEFSIASRDWLLGLIDKYHDIIADNYLELASCLVEKDGEIFFKEETGGHEVASHLRMKVSKWARNRKRFGLRPYHLKDGEDGPIVGSWLYEYAIFNLVHILHTMDWENDLLIYSGW